jgi:hypothetical protein
MKTPQEVKRFRILGIILAVSVITSLFLVMFAFVKKSEADKQRAISERYASEARELERQTVYQRKLSEQSHRECQKLVDSLQAQLSKLKAQKNKNDPF